MKRVPFYEVDLLDADHIVLSDATRAMFMPRMSSVSQSLAKLALVVLITHLNNDGGKWIWDGLTMSKWANECNCSVRQLRRVRVGLETVGFIKTVQRPWSTNEFEVDAKAVIESGRHGLTLMEAQRARKRSRATLVLRDSDYHQTQGAEKDAEILAGATQDDYAPEAWRDKSVGRIFAEAFAEWPELAAGNRAGGRLFKDRVGDDRSNAAWFRDCTLVANMIRNEQSDLVMWVRRGAKPSDGSKPLRISSAAGWGQLLGAARQGSILRITGTDPAALPEGPLPVLDKGAGCLPSPLGSMSDAWQRTRQQITPFVDDPRFDEVWLSKGRCTSVEDGRLVVEFPNRFYLEFVEGKIAEVDWEAVDIPIRLTCSE